METTNKKLGRPKTTLGTAKSSHLISKFNAVTTSSTRIIPTIRIVQIFAPQVFETDPAHFRALVQKLTGMKMASKKIKGTVGSKKKDSIHLKKNMVQEQSEESHSHASTVIDERFSPKELRENEYHVVDLLAGIQRDSVEEDGVEVCNNFSELFGGLEELNFFTGLRDSGSMLPELPTIYPPTAEQNDYHGSIFKAVNCSGLGYFYQ